MSAMTKSNLERGEQALREYLAQPARPGQVSHANAHWVLALIYTARGDRDAALREYEAGLALEPNNAGLQAAVQAFRRQ
jgi:Tfp pilus assembly protein PilF